ncbi:small GTP-binding protein [Histomonas meleagridis]|uniref:small GTP-binding protein n=1 Tax=Histomonas meleagridis TaxID=135588 RepID=UPI00355A1162|nr:small GTP-binding protein [Histomonas meleagridis]KAH0803906.1 small GTP-binding protein [Histomonas meleagridis]
MNESKHKVVLLGDPYVGKTSIMHRLTCDSYISEYNSTIGTGFGNWKIGSTVLQIWDTGGQEKYKSLGGIYYQNSEAAIVVCSKENLSSLKNIDFWVQNYESVVGNDSMVVIVANKKDSPMTTDLEEVEFKRLTKWAKERGFSLYETSAKTGENVEEIFKMVAQTLQTKRNSPNKFVIHPSVLSRSAEKCGNCC